MTLAETSVAVREAIEEEAERIARRGYLRGLMDESDLLMDKLERCNLRGQEKTPRALRPRLKALSLTVLGAELSDQHPAVWQVQAALERLCGANGVQDILMDRMHPRRAGLRASEREGAE